MKPKDKTEKKDAVLVKKLSVEKRDCEAKKDGTEETTKHRKDKSRERRDCLEKEIAAALRNCLWREETAKSKKDKYREERNGLEKETFF